MGPVRIIMATKSKHKVAEIKAMLNGQFDLVTMEEAGFDDDIIEDGDTLEENAWIKANTIYSKTGQNVFGEDTGLEIEALNGAPGVITAIYAGHHRSDNDNIQKVLSEMEGIENRKARFRTIIALWFNNKKYSFEGIVNGSIALNKEGVGGFGYDPVFIPDGYDHTFAGLTVDVKNTISHRANAVIKLIEFLTQAE